MITIDRKALLDPLSMVAKMTTSKIQILECVLIEAHNGNLTITGQNLTVSLSAKVQCKCNTWVGCVPALKLLSAVKAAPSGDIVIKPDKNTVNVLSGRSKMRLPFFPSADYPAIEHPDEPKTDINAGELLSALNCVGAAMPKNDVRLYLNGVFFDGEDGLLKTVATDGLRLAYAELPSELKCNVIIPAGSIGFLKDLLSMSDSIAFQVSSRSLTAYIENFTFSTQFVDGKYPNWEQVVPKLEHCAVVNSAAMISALERAAIILEKTWLNIKTDRIDFLAEATQGKNEKMEDTIDCSSNAEAEIGCMAPHMIDAIRAADAETVEILFTDAQSRFIVRAVGKEQPYTVVTQVM